jgi:hypothetical protein
LVEAAQNADTLTPEQKRLISECGIPPRRATLSGEAWC